MPEFRTDVLLPRDPDAALEAATKQYVDARARVVLAFSKAGTLTTGTGTHRLYNDSGSTMTIVGVRASVGTAPTGASIIVDINVGGSTIFSTQGNRPTIAASGNTSGKVTNMNTTTIADGGYFTVDIDQVGSTVAGADLTVQILLGV